MLFVTVPRDIESKKHIHKHFEAFDIHSKKKASIHCS